MLDAVVLLPDRLHCIWTLPAGDSDFSGRWRRIKASVSRAVGQQIEAEPTPSRRLKGGGLWQRRFWEHVIRDEADFAAHLDYIHFNPVRHGLVERAADWPWWSLHRYVAEGTYPPDWGQAEMTFPGAVGRE
jgi:putative transposase